MRNRNVGFLIIGIAVVIIFIIFAFNSGLKKIVGQTCTHGPSCSMYDTIAIQSWVSLGIAGLILVIGLFLIFAKEQERVIVKRVRPIEIKKMNIKKRFDKKLLNKLNGEERKIMKLLLENEGSMMQSSMREKTGFSKVKTTRLLDKLEGKGLVKRERRGMSNVVLLKD